MEKLLKIWLLLGEDSDLCSDLLQETLEALTSLPEASLFDAESVSDVWLEVVDRTSNFLRSVVLEGDSFASGGGTASGSSLTPIPVSDRHTALSLLLELAIQKGTLIQSKPP